MRKIYINLLAFFLLILFTQPKPVFAITRCSFSPSDIQKSGDDYIVTIRNAPRNSYRAQVQCGGTDVNDLLIQWMNNDAYSLTIPSPPPGNCDFFFESSSTACSGTFVSQASGCCPGKYKFTFCDKGGAPDWGCYLEGNCNQRVDIVCKSPLVCGRQGADFGKCVADTREADCETGCVRFGAGQQFEIPFLLALGAKWGHCYKGLLLTIWTPPVECSKNKCNDPIYSYYDETKKACVNPTGARTLWDLKNRCDNTSIEGIQTAIGCIPTKDLPTTLQFLLKFAFGIAGGVIVLMVIATGYTILTSAGNPEKLQAAKENIVAIFSGLMLIVFSLILLQVIGADILKLPTF